MGLVNGTTFNFIVKQGEKFVESSIIRKPRITNVEGLKYMPQKWSADVAEISKTEEKILQELVNKGLSLNEIASKCGVKIGKIRRDLEKYNIITEAQKEFRILKEYFTASTKEEKDRAFREIDKYLEQIAKEEFKQKKGSTYEDCLQDVRLRFFELVEKNKNNGVLFPYGILKVVRSSGKNSHEIRTVSLDLMEKLKTEPAVSDGLIEKIESEDFKKGFLDYCRYYFNPRAFLILEQYIKDGKSMNEIAEYFGLGSERIRQILDKTSKKARRCIGNVNTDEFIKERADFACRVAEDSASRELDRKGSMHLSKMTNSNYYYV